MLNTPRKILLDLISQYLAEPHPDQVKPSHVTTCHLKTWLDDNYWVEFRMLTRAEKELEDQKHLVILQETLGKTETDAKKNKKPIGKIEKGI